MSRSDPAKHPILESADAVTRIANPQASILSGMQATNGFLAAFVYGHLPDKFFFFGAVKVSCGSRNPDPARGILRNSAYLPSGLRKRKTGERASTQTLDDGPAGKADPNISRVA